MGLRFGPGPFGEQKTFCPLLGMESLTLGLLVRYQVTIPTTLSQIAGVVGPHPFFAKGAPKCEWWRFNEFRIGGGICAIRT